MFPITLIRYLQYHFQMLGIFSKYLFKFHTKGFFCDISNSCNTILLNGKRETIENTESVCLSVLYFLKTAVELYYFGLVLQTEWCHIWALHAVPKQGLVIKSILTTDMTGPWTYRSVASFLELWSKCYSTRWQDAAASTSGGSSIFPTQRDRKKGTKQMT